MSSNKRATRAGSRAASSNRAASPPVIDLQNLISSGRPVPVLNTPAAERGHREASLPAIVPRESTSYGGTGISRPSSVNPAGRAPLTETLGGMLDDEDDEPAPVRARNSRTPSRGPTKKNKTRATPGRATRPTSLAPIVENVAPDAQTLNRDNSPAVIFARASSTAFGTPSVINAEANINNTPLFRPRGAGALRAPMEANRGTSGITPAGGNGRQSLHRNPEAGLPLAGGNVWEYPRRSPEADSSSTGSDGRRSPHRNPEAGASGWSKVRQTAQDSVIHPLSAQLRRPFSTVPGSLIRFGLLLCFIISAAIVLICASGNSSGPVSSCRWYGLGDLHHNIGQFIPNRVLTPYLDDDGQQAVRSLSDRVSTVEYNVAQLMRQPSLDQKSVTFLNEFLPNFIVAKKDSSGKLQIPEDFWRALKEKIGASPGFDSAKGSDPSAGTYSSWKEWLEKNEAQIRSWNAKDFEQAYNKHIQASFKNNVLISKADLVKMIDDKYKDSSKDVLKEIKKLNIELESEIRRVKNNAQNAALAKADVEKMVDAYLRKYIPKRQLDALAQVNLNGNLKDSLSRVNHFSVKTGAIIMPRETAPSYEFAKGRGRAWYAQPLLKLMGRGLPAPNKPIEALSKWEEHGDCWCSPGPTSDQESAKNPPQLAVLTGNNIHPDTVIIEHIPRSATLSPGSTPREIEILAFIEDGYTRGPLLQQSYNLISDQRHDEMTSKGWVRIARFRYDINGPSSQAFQTQVRMADFVGMQASEQSNGDEPDLLRPYSRKFIVRIVGNYGEDFSCLYRVRLHGEVVSKEVLEAGANHSMEVDEIL